MFLRTCRILVIAAIGVITVSCATEAPPGLTDADRAEIAATTQEAVAISNTTRDWAQYAAVYYAPDAIVMPPNQEKVQGREAIAAWLGGFPPFEQFVATQIEVDGVGDVAYVYGTYSMVMALPDSEEPLPDRGKYVEIWRRQADGSWKITLDIFNSDLPIPEG